MNKERHNNGEDESEVESKVVTVGSNQDYKLLVIVTIVILICGVYYLYFSHSNKESLEVIRKGGETRQNIQELKGRLEQVPDDIIVSERIINDPLPSLPPLPIPEDIPEVKQIKKGEVTKKEEQSKEVHISNIPILTKQNFPSGNVISNLPTIGRGVFPKERRSTQMLIISGDSEEGKVTDDILSNTAVQSSKATKIGKPGLMITQGKIIDAILETAISSDIKGMLRAIVSRDVYAETGDIVLIPRGSRLVGNYSFESNSVGARVNINWNRIILPHGIDIAISSSSIDELGRAGIAGIVDTKIVSMLFSSVILAGISIGSSFIWQKSSNIIDVLTVMDAARSIVENEIDIFSLKEVIISRLEEGAIKIAIRAIEKEKWKLGSKAISRIQNASSEQNLFQIIKEEIAKVLSTALLEKIVTDKDIPITLEDVKALLIRTTQKKNKSVYKSAIEKLINNFSKNIRDIVDRSVDKKPIVYVDQGTKLKVFVNKDIVFSPQAILN